MKRQSSNWIQNLGACNGDLNTRRLKSQVLVRFLNWNCSCESQRTCQTVVKTRLFVRILDTIPNLNQYNAKMPVFKHVLASQKPDKTPDFWSHLKSKPFNSWTRTTSVFGSQFFHSPTIKKTFLRELGFHQCREGISVVPPPGLTWRPRTGWTCPCPGSHLPGRTSCGKSGTVGKHLFIGLVAKIHVVPY